jgi:WW domain
VLCDAGLAEFVDGHNEADALKLLDEETKVEPFSVSPSRSVKSPAKAGSTGDPKSPAGPVTSPDATSPQPERRNSVALNKEAEDWVEYFDMNKMKIYYYNTLTGKTRWTMPKELVSLYVSRASLTLQNSPVMIWLVFRKS